MSNGGEALILSIEHNGVLVDACGLSGEQKQANIFPAHPSGMQLSRNRWLLLIATRGVRQHDDDHSIVYQLRADTPDGTLLREGFLQQTCSDWDPFQDGSSYVCLLRHAMGFGIPKGALIKGKPAQNANRFAAIWCRSAAGVLDSATGLYTYNPELERKTLEVVWCQFRLNDTDDDIEILRKPEKMRQNGYASGTAFCHAEQAGFMIANLVPPVPFNDNCCEWISAMHSGIGIMVVKFRYDDRTGIYEWVETGPARLGNEQFALSEPTLARGDDAWIIGVRVRYINPQQVPDWAGDRARDRGHTGWIKVEDPFREMPFPKIVEDPHREAPMTIYRCADGVIRLFSGDLKKSPYGQRRDPIYCWDVNTDDFSVSNRRVVFDSVKAGVFPDDPKLPRCTSFACVFPHGGGAAQTVAHRVMCYRYLPEMDPGNPPISPEQMLAHGIYYASIRYQNEYPPFWHFTEKSN
jgi:hypothetical protein